MQNKAHFLDRYHEFLSHRNWDEDQAFSSIGKLLGSAIEKGKRTSEQSIHALEVARIVCDEIGLGHIAAKVALLHNLVESGTINLGQVEGEFGNEVSSLLLGYSRISAFRARELTIESENFRKLLFNLAGDIRVILIKLADRLYHVRHIEQLPEEKRENIILEANHLYAGIAHKVGLYGIKTELEDKALSLQEPDIYNDIVRKLRESHAERESYISSFIEPLKEALDKAGFRTEIKGRSKSVASILHKMQKQDVDFEQVYDLFAIRIIIDSETQNEKSDCWKVYSIVTGIFPPNPKRLRDWVSSPRANGYESLHTTVLGNEGKWVEIQIRTRRMDDFAEKGPAAHWRYKGGDESSEADRWLQRFRNALDHPEARLGAEETEIAAVYAEDIFVFTPMGELRRLPAGATVLDFAFDIHSAVGSSCQGARVNGKIVPIRHQLSNGDTVEILRNKNQVPKFDWLQFVATTKAKNRIRRAIKEHQYKQADLGKEIFQKKLEQLKLAHTDHLIKQILDYFQFKEILELYQACAEDKVEVSDIKKALETHTKAGKQVHTTVEKPDPQDSLLTRLEPGALLIDNDPDIRDFTLAHCCKPVYGAEVFAFITVGKGITVHRLSCPNAKQMRERYPYRVLEAEWTEKAEKQAYIVTLKINGIDRPGLVSELTTAISNTENVHLNSINIRAEKIRFSGKLEVEVQHHSQTGILMRKLQSIDGIEKVFT